MKLRLALAAAAAALATTPTLAHAFCGFYVGGGGAELFNNATQVVLMRDGTRTVLSMQNNYQGPPSDFAMVVPVPVVLQEANVKTLPREVFAKVDQMGSPRLVEYWEADPCAPDEIMYDRSMVPMMEMADDAPSSATGGSHGVTIEAQFTVGEYQIVILSAKDSTGLDAWLREQKYQIPKGAEPLLRPYVEAGSKFFVAKVDPKKVTFDHGMAQLSPLRFHYDSDEFSLPVRLGMANSSGTQDLIVNILAPSQRYQVANYGNVTIPTNLDVKPETKTQFGAFYAALFDRTVEQNPGAVVTEYAWDASTCDPCPGPNLDGNDFMTLGADVLGTDNYWGLVLTRLHARYAKGALTDDLVFKGAEPIVGGREFVVDDATGKLEERSRPSDTNNFQGRYAIRHAWTGPITCANPVRGRWGGPPGDQLADATPQAATNIAFAPRGTVSLPDLVTQDIPELGVVAGVALAGPKPVSKASYPGCTCAASGGVAGGAAGAAGAGAVLALVLRRRRRR
ncbi:MAG: DUF2330 domain-containing protein [Myxococcales bacterium]|nr:DUF2330 domain-containing protein [Myxococcales bacterium]